MWSSLAQYASKLSKPHCSYSVPLRTLTSSLPSSAQVDLKRLAANRQVWRRLPGATSRAFVSRDVSTWVGGGGGGMTEPAAIAHLPPLADVEGQADAGALPIEGLERPLLQLAQQAIHHRPRLVVGVVHPEVGHPAGV